VKERPILFSGPMVRAILDGRKTQTRRVVKFPLRHPDFNCEVAACELAGEERSVIQRMCPYGVPGYRLWVRETWDFRPWSEPENRQQVNISYGADGEQRLVDAPAAWNPILYSYERWRPSIHMPRWASRLTLEVTGVRVERLQDISEEDALAEGCKVIQREGQSPCYVFSGTGYDDAKLCHTSPVTAFGCFWDELNGPDAWCLNPWVWVVEFKKEQP
jgi:hypothetical protein